MKKIGTIVVAGLIMASCGAKGSATDGAADTSVGAQVQEGADASRGGVAAGLPVFSADSAYRYLARQVEFGPRVPNTPAHEQTADWLASELRRHGAQVTLQKADLRAFDGTMLKATNIMGSYNPDMTDRLLLLAHYDTRPWADSDANQANHSKPIDGANDGASGVAVLLELARLFNLQNPGIGIDILFVDAEDYGAHNDDDSWALGTRYFAQNPIKPGYKPSRAILLDMVGGKGAVFPAEYFSRESAPVLDDAVRAAASRAGHAERFPAVYGSAVTDDHVQLIEAGIPAIDIIDYRQDRGFAPTWHTLDDNLQNIDPATLRAVGETLIHFLYNHD